MLEYNKELQIKSKDGTVLYTIKNLTLDAEYELDMLNYKIQEAREELLATGKYDTISTVEMELVNKFIELTSIENPSEEILTEITNINEKLMKFDKARQEKGVRLLLFIDVLRALKKETLVEMVRWLKANIAEFKEKSYFECATELNSISEAFVEYKNNIKKKL